ncbi:MAG TPA: radical SAM peptide maturase [Porphyromonadaceae bacterium]|nr:radical SAM peptide maturase [Porphyromonadaceae bacterium]
MINYCFNHKDTYCTPQKNYSLRLQKTDDKIEIIKEKKIPDKAAFLLDRTRIHPKHITADNVSDQLANIGHIGFEVTDACNLQCYYCAYRKFYADYDTRKNQYLDIQKAKMLLDFVLEKSGTPANKSPRKEMLINFYGGEPLLNMDFITEMVAYTQSRENDRIQFKYSMTTNGVLLKKYLPFFIRYDFDILVSLDGSKEHDAYRLFHNGKPSFDAVYGNMMYIRDNYPVFFEKNILFNAVVQNLSNKQEVFRFFQREFNKTPSFANVNPVGIRPELEKEFEVMATPRQEIPDPQSDVEMKRVMDLNYDQTRKLQNFIFLYSGNKYNDYNDLFFKKEPVSYISGGTCFPFSKKIFMTVNNKLLPCERIGQQFFFGRMTDNGVEIDCEEIAQKYNHYCDALKELCKPCYHVSNCMECMFGIKNLERKPVCSKLVKKKGFDDYLRKGIEQLANAPELYKRIMDEVFSV